MSTEQAHAWPGLEDDPNPFVPAPRGPKGEAGSGSGGGGSHILGFVLTEDVTNTGVLDGVWSDVVPSTAFTVASDDGFIEITVAASALQGDVPSPHTVTTRVLIDGAGGSPVAVPLGSEQSTAGATANPFSGAGPAIVTGLAAGAHTVQVQCTSSGDTHFYCRPASQNPFEFLRLDIVEFT